MNIRDPRPLERRNKFLIDDCRSLLLRLLTLFETKEEKEEKQKKASILQRFLKRTLTPFINRISSSIYDRIVYYKNLTKLLKPKTNNCLEFFKITRSNEPYVDFYGKEIRKITDTYEFKIGNNIILKKQIGRESKYGIIFLSTIEKNPYYKFAIKIVKDRDLEEIKILKDLSALVIKNKCPHFSIVYEVLKCEDWRVIRGFKKLPENYTSIYPKMLTDKDDRYNSILMELANGDMYNFLDNDFTNNWELLGNAVIQIVISLLFFYKHTNKIHADAHGGNFLYHKIKEGGVYHYKICDEDYYLENLGLLWVINDFGISTDFYKKKILTDFYNIIAIIYNIIKGTYKEHKKWDTNPLFNIYDKLVLDIYTNFRSIRFNNNNTSNLEAILNLVITSLNIDVKNSKNKEVINPKPFIINKI